MAMQRTRNKRRAIPCKRPSQACHPAELVLLMRSLRTGRRQMCRSLPASRAKCQHESRWTVSTCDRSGPSYHQPSSPPPANTTLSRHRLRPASSILSYHMPTRPILAPVASSLADTTRRAPRLRLHYLPTRHLRLLKIPSKHHSLVIHTTRQNRTVREGTLQDTNKLQCLGRCVQALRLACLNPTITHTPICRCDIHHAKLSCLPPLPYRTVTH